MSKEDVDAKAIAKQIKADILNKNVVTISEFSEYRPLFDQSIRVGGLVDPSDIEELFLKYRTRFSPMHPIIVVSDDKQTVLEKRPPASIQFPLFNEVLNKPDVLLDSYSNITTSESQPAHKKKQISNTLHSAFRVVINSDKFKDNTARVMKLEAERESAGKRTSNHKLPKEKTVKAREAMKGMEWE